MLKLKDGFMLRNVADKYVVVAFGKRAVDFNGMISLNDTGAFIWGLFENDCTEEAAVQKLCAEYDIDEQTAKTDVHNFIKKLRDADLLE